MVKVSSRLVRLTVQIVFLCFVLVGGASVKNAWSRTVPKWL